MLSNAKINTSDNTVTVSGFAYSDYYVTEDHAGQKLIVEISGLKPHKAGRLSADGDSAVYKVTPETGETLQVASFPGVSDCYVPLEPKVQDFSTSFTVTNNMLNYNDAEGAMTLSNGAFQFDKASLTFQLNKLNLSSKGGTFRLDTGVNSIPYVDNTPKAENWHWSMAYLIPANNIYYDEDLTGMTGNSSPDGYGYNSAAEDASYHAANVSSAENMVTLEFTFIGTGIDVYCTTDSNTGDVIYMLDGKGAKVMKNKNANDTIYNVPTVSLRDLDPDTHTLKIIVAKNANYAIDGIRVYRPMAGNATAEAIYAETKEANATFELVRERLLNGSASFDDENTAFSADDAKLSGTLYLSGEYTTEITQEYRNNSPKSEVYLAEGEGVAFQIDGYDKDHQKVMIGLSAPRDQESTGKVIVSNGNGLVKTIDIKSAVDMYYLVQPDDDGNVFVKNNGSALISVTRVKLTDDGMQAVAAETEPAQEAPSRLIVSKSLLRYVESFDTLPVSEDAPETTPIPAEPEPSATPTPTPQPGGIGQIVQNLVSSLFQTIFQNISSLFRGLSKW